MEPKAADNLIEKVFGEGGLVSRFHENYEYREGQIRMAEHVEQALASRRHLIVEAGTGTGKTLAYLGSGDRRCDIAKESGSLSQPAQKTCRNS
jgi:ATP-dependent DNA helicase DinG